jgi:hypothetical protein
MNNGSFSKSRKDWASSMTQPVNKFGNSELEEKEE